MGSKLYVNLFASLAQSLMSIQNIAPWQLDFEWELKSTDFCLNFSAFVWIFIEKGDALIFLCQALNGKSGLKVKNSPKWEKRTYSYCTEIQNDEKKAGKPSTFIDTATRFEQRRTTNLWIWFLTLPQALFMRFFQCFNGNVCANTVNPDWRPQIANCDSSCEFSHRYNKYKWNQQLFRLDCHGWWNSVRPKQVGG